MPYPNIQVLTTMGYNNFDKFRLDVFRLNRYYFHGLKARVHQDKPHYHMMYSGHIIWEI